MIVSLATPQMCFRFALEQRAEVCGSGEVDVGLHVAEAREWTCCYSSGPLANFRFELILRDCAVNQTEAEGLCGIDHITKKHQFFRLGSAGVMGEQPSGTKVAAIAHLRVRGS